MKLVRRRLSHTLILLLVAPILGLLTTVALVTPAHAAECGDVLIKGKDWLGGSGVDVKSNGPNEGTGVSCAGQVTYGFGYQCVELANRLYQTKGGIVKTCGWACHAA